jgi:hypothetical protein
MAKYEEDMLPSGGTPDLWWLQATKDESTKHKTSAAVDPSGKYVEQIASRQKAGERAAENYVKDLGKTVLDKE